MKPGRKLDALIAEKVMGWQWGEKIAFSPTEKRYSRVARPYNPWWWLPHYSIDIAAAWEVVMYMGKNGYRLNMRTDGKNTHAFFWKGNNPNDYENAPTEEYSKVTSHAICLAALKALNIPIANE